jgi:23S rRNA pseudouridine955/2504/2580 synthase
MNKNTVKYTQITEDRQGQRIDNYLISILKGVPKSLIYKIIRKGEVRVNKKRVASSYRLQTDDLVRVPPVRQSSSEEPANQAAKLPRSVASLLMDNILYEDEVLLIINKPAGIAVHGGSGLSWGIIEALRTLFPQYPQLELIHRLDKATSGCLMLAKRRSALRTMHAALRNGEVEKYYLALLKGQWQRGIETISLGLHKNQLSSGERIVKVSEQGKHSVSVFTPKAYFAEATLMQIQLHTGRTHQIRVHAAHLGHPLAGDDKYGEKSFNQLMRQHGLKRMFLHAESLRFKHPRTQQPIVCSAPLDQALSLFLAKIHIQQ